MKKMMIALTMMLLTAATGKAMSYEQARNEALFLTDKMAYELNLTDEQYEAAYEINLDYLMGVASRDDVLGEYWERRNLDLSYILLEWQWNAFCAATYFYRPLYWSDGFWHFAVYARYPHRDYFFFGRPVFYATYRGGHAWHVVGGRGYYHGHRDHYRPVATAGRSHFGMLDRWNRGDYNHGRHHATRPGNGNSMHHGGPRSSSTQSTVNRPNRNSFGHSTMSENRQHRSDHSSMTTKRPTNTERVNQSQVSGSFGRSNSHSSSVSSISGSHSNSSHSSGSFSRSSGSSSNSSGSFSRSSGSSSHSSGSFSRSNGSSHSSSSAGRSSSGGRSFGGRR
jgi:hypothetical protein